MIDLKYDTCVPSPPNTASSQDVRFGTTLCKDLLKTHVHIERYVTLHDPRVLSQPVYPYYGPFIESMFVGKYLSR